MKKLIALLLALCLLTLSAACAEDLLDKVRAAGEIRIATEGQWQPWTYHDETGKLTGFDIELGEAVAAALGVTPVFMETAWGGMLAGLGTRWDIAINGVGITEERQAAMTFSTPYCFNRTVLVVKADNETITSFADLKGKRTANSIGSTYMELAEQYGASAIGVDTLDQTIEMIVYGRADATLNAEVSVLDYLRVKPDAPIRIVARTAEATAIGIPMPREGSETLAAEINAVIEALRADGTLAALSEKYFGSDITAVPEI